jgi:hypothetical protein
MGCFPSIHFCDRLVLSYGILLLHLFFFRLKFFALEEAENTNIFLAENNLCRREILKILLRSYKFKNY